ncbi:MAG: GNAT family N-acetyltransferase [Thermoplasmata archaeon]|nr:GNAT family N-acetyltransferase [Thermoplasmata archaeon]
MAGLLTVERLFDHPLPPEVARAYLADRRNVVFVAIAGGNGVGYLRATALLQPHTLRRQMFLYEIAVEAAKRRRGVGRSLVEALLSYCRRRKFDEVFVFTSPYNRAATRLYRSTGAVTETRADRMYVYLLRSGRPRTPRDTLSSNRG